MEGVWGVCGGVFGMPQEAIPLLCENDDSAGSSQVNENVNLKPEIVPAAEGSPDLPCGDGGGELRPQQGQFLPLEIPEAGGEEHHLLPQVGRVWTADCHLPDGRPEILCDVCRPEDEGGDGGRVGFASLELRVWSCMLFLEKWTIFSDGRTLTSYKIQRK